MGRWAWTLGWPVPAAVPRPRRSSPPAAAAGRRRRPRRRPPSRRPPPPPPPPPGSRSARPCCGARSPTRTSPRAAAWSRPAGTRAGCGPTTTPTSPRCSSASSPTAGRAGGWTVDGRHQRRLGGHRRRARARARPSTTSTWATSATTPVPGRRRRLPGGGADRADGAAPGGGTTAPATAIRLRYDDGPHDAESLMVHPTTGDIYVVRQGRSATPASTGPAPGRTPSPGSPPSAWACSGWPPGPTSPPTGGGWRCARPSAATSSPSTRAPPFDAIWDRPPAPVTFPGLEQGEAIAYRLDGDALFVTSEGSPSPLYEIPRL